MIKVSDKTFWNNFRANIFRTNSFGTLVIDKQLILWTLHFVLLLVYKIRGFKRKLFLTYFANANFKQDFIKVLCIYKDFDEQFIDSVLWAKFHLI